MTPKVYAPIFINKFLSEKISEIMPENFSNGVKFFPTSPTDINSLTETFPETASEVFGVYDRMFKIRRLAFPHIKPEQIMMYLYKMSGNMESLIETTQVVFDLLDNEDESAEFLNQWIASKIKDGKVTFDGKDFYPIYFHNFKVYQLQENRDVINFGTVRSLAGSKLIIDYDYHVIK